MPAESYGWAGVVIGVLLILWLIFRQIEKWISVEKQAERETRDRLASEKAREKEKEIRDAADRIRREPGPVLPDLDRLPDRPSGPPPPA